MQKLVLNLKQNIETHLIQWIPDIKNISFEEIPVYSQCASSCRLSI